MSVLLSSLMLAVAVTLRDASEYHYLTGSIPYQVRGEVLANAIIRGEDMAFLTECMYERKNVRGALMDSAYPIAPADRPFPRYLMTFTPGPYLIGSTMSDGNTAMSTNSVAMACTFAPSSLYTGDGKQVDTNGVQRYAGNFGREIAAMWTGGEIPCTREGDYDHVTGFGRLPRRATLLHYLADFTNNTGVCFDNYTRTDTNTFERMEARTAYHYVYNVKADGSWTTTSTTNYRWQVSATNTFAGGAFAPFYRELKTLETFVTYGFNGATQLAAEDCYSEQETELFYRRALYDLYVEFAGPIATNAIQDIRLFGVYEVNNTLTITGRVDTLVKARYIAPLTYADRPRRDGHGKMYTVTIAWPDMAERLVTASGATPPGGYNLGAAVGIDRTVPEHTSSGLYDRNGPRRSGTIDLTVQLVGVVGLADILYHARAD